MVEEIEYYEKGKPKTYNRKKIAIVIFLLVIISGAYVYYAYFYGPTYNDVGLAINEMMKTGGESRLYLSDLSDDRCYWIRPMYNSSGHYVEIIEYGSNNNCMGSIEDKTTIKLDSALNMGAWDCLCDDDSYKITKDVNERGTYLKVDP